MTEDSASRLQAMFNRDMVLITSTPKEGFDPALLLNAHLDFIVSLEKRGLLFLSGPLFSEAGVMNGSGLTVLSVTSVTQAREIWGDEPFYKAGQRSADFQLWRLMEGRIGLTVDLSDRRVELATRTESDE